MPIEMRLPPHSVEAEQSLIGSLLLNNAAWDLIEEIVTEADFYRDDHRRIFRHITRLIESGKPADAVTVFESLEKTNESEQAGGLAYLGDIANNTPSAANIRRYAEIVHERAVHRHVASVGSELSDMALAPGPQRLDDLLDEAEAKLYNLRPVGKRGESVALGGAVGRVVERMERARGGDFKESRIPCGLAGLDKIMRGMGPGELVILAARPSLGKSALALNIAINAAELVPVLYMSLEMTTENNAERALSYASGISLQGLQGDGPCKLKQTEWASVSEGFGKLWNLPITLHTSMTLTMPKIAAIARRTRRHGLGLVVVDYLQLISPAERYQNRVEMVSEISRRLKTMAMDLGVPVLAVSQLNRAAQGERPTLANLRDSGSIEQDADTVLLLHEPDGEPTELIVAKNRSGRCGSIWLSFDREHARFTETDEPSRSASPSIGVGRKRGFHP